MEEEEKCRFEDMCREYHPEEAMEEKRKQCNSKNCRECAVYWAYQDGYNWDDWW